MTIIIEDGSNVPNANAYVTLAETRDYALARGVTLSADDTELSVQLIKSTDYLESLADKYQGSRTYIDQALQWPRTGVVLYGNAFPSNKIPKELKKAQCALVIDVHNGVDLMPNYSASDYIIEETVGPITTIYADPTKVGVKQDLTSSNALLNPLFKQGFSGLAITTVRV